MPEHEAAGVAFSDTFDTQHNVHFSPALIYSNRNGNRPDIIAETVSHEVGHNLKLGHDGRDFTNKPDEEYYRGNPDPSNPISWAPIMGRWSVLYEGLGEGMGD